MSSKSQSTAKLLLVALVAIAATSGYYVKQWSQEAESAKSRLASVQRAAKEAERAHQELSSQLTPDTSSKSLQDAVTAVMLDVYNRRLPHAVTVASVAPGKFAASGSMSPLDTLTEVIPGTKVQSMRVNIRGTYSDYLGLLRYIKDMQAHPLSVVHLKVQDQAYELGLRVYGDLTPAP
ncbi:hypothetical protein [Variovorax sp. WDL1]|uniref:hypothetical protein n=1 Tax=Variovorax sp. WDL1 TaxID=207745 RepID=UPI0011AF6D61|nr:hypothetical protein [Variovorax sp. WDL1]